LVINSKVYIFADLFKTGVCIFLQTRVLMMLIDQAFD